MLDPPSLLSSIASSDGCCLTDCANALAAAVNAGCFQKLMAVVCRKFNNRGYSYYDAAKFRIGLANLSGRCVNFYPAPC
jgi:hypothetical protein